MANTTVSRAEQFMRQSKQVSRTKKQSKPAQARVFGPSSQFRGVQVGVLGDPRK